MLNFQGVGFVCKKSVMDLYARHWRTMPSTTFLWYVGQVCPKRLERGGAKMIQLVKRIAEDIGSEENI